jgi:uncharacterized repeat protein (TIGR01451 family)
LTANCATTSTAGPLSIDPGITTLDGGGFTISASDTPLDQWNGGIVQIPSGQTAAITNLTVSGPPTGFSVSTNVNNVVYGIWFMGASGSVSGVTVEHIWQQPNLQAPLPNRGTAIRADGPGTVTITGTTVLDYQKNGIDGRNAGMTMDVSGSAIGPPHNFQGFIAPNGLLYVSGASGTATDDTIFGAGDQVGGGPDTPTDGDAVLLFGATNVTIDHNTITSDPSTAGTDIGISVTAGSTGIVLSNNTIGRIAPDSPDPTGIGIAVCSPPAAALEACADDPDGTSSATLICNTFSNWNTNIVGALQIDCTPLPPGTVCQPYTANLPAVQGGTAPFTWSTPGPLPPGLTLSPDGAITGTPTSDGTFPFTANVVDSSSPTTLSASQDESITIAAGTCPAPAILLVKTASVSSFSASGTVVTYSFKVSNTGTAPLSNVAVTDPLVGLSPITCPAGSLAIGASMTCTATYTTTSADVSRGNVMNTATATGTDPSGVPAGPSTSTATIPAVTIPAPAAPAAPVSPITPTQVQVTG